MALKFGGLTWDEWTRHTSKLVFPSHLFDFSLRDIYPSPSVTPRWQRKPAPTYDRKRLLTLLGVLSASVTQAHPFALCSDVEHRQALRQYRSYVGDLKTNSLSNQDLTVLQRQLRSSGKLFQDLTKQSPHVFTCIVDSGCSYSATNTFTDVDPTTLRKLQTPITLGGIAGSLAIEYVGRANWETLDDQGRVVIFQEDVLIHPDLPDRLLSPQSFLSRQGKTSDNSSHFRVYHNRAEWHRDGAKVLTMDYDSSYLPRLVMFSKGQSVATLNAFTSVLHSTNSNLTALQKLWMQWHIKLGHLSFSHVQTLGIAGYLDKLGLGLRHSKIMDQPVCTACQYGKQTRRPDETTTTSKRSDHQGNLLVNQLTPGDRIFVDHLESRTRGRLFHTAGHEPAADKFCGAMVFCDAASGYIHVEPQVTLNATDTILAKDSFERMALQLGITVNAYHTDNGVFKSQRFVHEIHTNAQSIRFSGVGAKWQNGVAEGAIRIIVSRARTMMLHASLHWPEMDDESLWPMAISHASYMYNHTPNEHTGIAPIETFTGTISDGQALRNLHTWGCPAYVLEPRLHDSGSKIPKWQPRSRRAQYMGVSPVHAETVGLVRNLHTGYISPQYHLVFDDWFETVSSVDLDHLVPPSWDHLCIFNRFEIVFDDELYGAPLLSDEWLTADCR